MMEAQMAKNTERAKLVRKQREERAWTQSQLADVAGINLRTVQRLERDGAASFETLMAVAQAFDKMDVKLLTSASRAPAKEKAPLDKKVYLMPKITSGKDLSNLVVGSDQFQVEHDDDHDPRSIAAMKDILNLLKHDVVRLYDADPAKRLDVEAEMSQEIQGLENYGYYLFGIKRVIPQIAEGRQTLVSMTTLYMSHSRSPKIVKDKTYMVIPASLPEVAQ